MEKVAPAVAIAGATSVLANVSRFGRHERGPHPHPQAQPFLLPGYWFRRLLGAALVLLHHGSWQVFQDFLGMVNHLALLLRNMPFRNLLRLNLAHRNFR